MSLSGHSAVSEDLGKMQVGDLIDNKYELIRLIGHGGMGTVYEARHVHIGRRFALKFLHTRLSKDPQISARFLREAQAATAAGSEHIVSVNDIGTSPEGAPYLVLEFIDGVDLSALVKQLGPVEAGRAARLMFQVCRGLGAAHARGIIHRDLKPENLMLTVRDDGAEWIKILDFGVAKFKDALAADSGQLTGAATFLGTPQYMAPEQMGEAKDADWRSDIYSAGVVLFELLAGRPPYEAASLGKLLVALSSDPPPLRSFRPDIDGELERVVSRAMERAPDDRFQSMEELANALLPFSDIRPSQRPVTLAMGKAEAVGAMPTLPSAPGELQSNPNVTTPATPIPPVGTPSPSAPGSQPGSQPGSYANVRTPTPGQGGVVPISHPGSVSPALEPTKPRRSHWYILAAALGLGVAVLAAVFVVIITSEGGGFPWSNGQTRATDGQDGGLRSDDAGDARVLGADSNAVQDSGQSQTTCNNGKVPQADTPGRCCWPGQSWSNTARRCVGRPQCPGGLVARRQRCTCPRGQIKAADTSGHCCFPRQAWSSGSGRCVGRPVCPEGFWMHGESCFEVPPCSLGKVASTDTAGHCCWPGQTWSGAKRECSGSISCPAGFEDSGSICRPDNSVLGKLIQQCEAGNVGRCIDLGLEYHRGGKAELDHRRAANLYRKGCDGGDAAGCHNLGILYEGGLGVEQDHTKSVALFKRACERGSAVGCTGLGTAYHLGLGVEQDYLRASQVYQQACLRGEAHACNNLGLLYVDGTGVPQDFSKAAQQFQRACDLKSSPGCCSIGILHLRGLGTARDESKARGFIQKACNDREPWACQWLRDPSILGPNVQRLTYYGIARDVQGRAPIGRGAQCRIVVNPAYGCGHNCRVRIACGQQLIYGAGASGYNECRITQTVGAAPSIEVHDTGFSPSDSDPRLDLWTTAGRATVSDEGEELSWSASLEVSGPIAQ